MKKKVIIGTLCIISIFLFVITIYVANNKPYYQINLETLTYGEESLSIRTYDDFESFLTDYNSDNLPDIYVTKFLFDGVSTYKPYDLDDFVKNGNDYVVNNFEITVLNICNIGKYELSGTIENAMIAVNTNNLNGNVYLLLNNVTIDTNSKKIPVLYAYNKDINYTDSRVIVKTLPDTKNYLEGGKFKKVSLVSKDKLDNYNEKYSGESKTNYATYTNYYGIYSDAEIDNILFAKVEASNEDLMDGDPYYFYKGAGAISSDIDMYFDGEGYLEINSKNKEGIETKGNLAFIGGTGDYVVKAYDDCLNTTSKSDKNKTVRNTLSINVNSLQAIVSKEADEGDAIDSNGDLIINGGIILAIAKSGADAGIDSETGTYIYGGEIIATGDMYDEVSSNSTQRFMLLSFASRPNENDLIVLTDEENEAIFAYKTDRTFQNLIYSSNKLENKTYYLYQNGEINGEENNGVYLNITSYKNGIQLGYSDQKMMMNPGMGGPNGFPGGDMPEGEIPNNPFGNETPSEKPEGEMPNRNGAPLEKLEGEMPNASFPEGQTPPEIPGGEGFIEQNQNGNITASNKEFTIKDIANIFSGIATYQE